MPDLQPLAPDGEDRGGPDLKVLVLFALGRFRVWVAVCVTLGLTAGLLYAFSLPNTFTADARLKLIAGKRENVTSERSAGLEFEGKRPAMMKDELALLNSARIFQEAARRVGPRQILLPADPRLGDTEDTLWLKSYLHELQATVFGARNAYLDDPEVTEDEIQYIAARRLRDSTAITDIRDSNLISIRVEATSQSVAQELGNVLAECCIEEHRRAFSTERYFDLNQAKRRTVQDNLMDAQRDYQEHVDLCGFVQLESQLGSLVEQWTEQSRSLEELRAEHDGKRARLETLLNAIEEVPRVIEETTRPLLGRNALIARLEEELRDIRLEKIRTVRDPVLTENTRRQFELYYDELIDKVESELVDLDQIVEIMPAMTQEVANPEHEALVRTTIELRAEVDGLQRRIEQLEEALNRETDRIDAARDCQPIHANMRRRMEDRERQLEALNTMGTELELMALLEEQGDTNLRLFQEASFPQEKDGPNRLRFLLMGLAGGAFLGLVVATGCQLMDTRVRYPESIERGLDLPLLAVVPELKGLAFRPRTASPSGATSPGVGGRAQG